MYKSISIPRTLRELNHYMLAKTLSMFEYERLPETLPGFELEKILQKNGFSFVTKHEGSLYAFSGGLGGEEDVYYNPTQIVVNNPALNLNKTFSLERDGVLIKNDSLMMGLMPIFIRFNTLVANNLVSMDMASFNTRMATLISASDNKTRESAENFLKKIARGETGVIGSNELFEGIKAHQTGSTSSTFMTQLIEYHQYIKSNLFNELGIDSPFNMKRERLNTAETDQNQDGLRALVVNMLQERQKGVLEINEKYGTEISVKFGGLWSKLNENLLEENSAATSGNDITGSAEKEPGEAGPEAGPEVEEQEELPEDEEGATDE